ncbi:hypothetical protein M426DRAFT_17150 [Hypoxylon sp. CI-4A]|nr:hypothetical protein M426DRAFT_17150 [Hypoxylon sp. CI-4A]
MSSPNENNEEMSDTMNIRPHLDSLPDELKYIIINFAGMKATLNLAKASPEFHKFIMSDEAYIASNAIHHTIEPELLPLALLRENIHSDPIQWKPSDDEESLKGVGEDIMTITSRWLGLKATRPLEQKPRFTLRQAKELEEFHETVSYYATTLSKKASHCIHRNFQLAHENGESVPESIKCVSEKEKHRFMKSLYIWQIASLLFPHNLDLPFKDPTQSPLYWAQEHFWLNFAPGINYFIVSVNESVQLYGHNSFTVEDEIINKFMVAKGLKSMHDFEENSTTQLQLNVMAGNAQLFSTNRQYSWFANDDEPWLLWDEDAAGLDIAVVTLKQLEKYMESDSGPLDAWFWTLLKNHADGNGQGESIYVQSRAKHLTQCEKNLALWGFVMWDREKHDWLSRGKMPTTEEMKEATQGKTIEFWTYKDARYARGPKVFKEDWE